jgi:hypothetical protein
MNSRQLAEKIWKECVQPAYTYAHEQDAAPEPEDKEAALQVLEGILEREASVIPDAELNRIRAENEKKGLTLG